MPLEMNEFKEDLQGLKSRVRNKAMEIAEELVEAGHSRRQAVDEGISRARKWAENVGRAADSKEKKWILHIRPHENGWAIQREGEDDPEHIFDSKDTAIEKAVDISKLQRSDLQIHDANDEIVETRTFA